jgi:Protein of unknown function (DUF2934)
MAKQPSGDKKVSKKATESSGDKKLSKIETESSGGVPPVAKRRKTEPDERQIKERAHRIWIDEGRPQGRDHEHWMRARQELEQEAE